MFLDTLTAVSLEKSLKKTCYNALDGFEPKYTAVRGICGFALGVGSLLATVIARVAIIAETLFKGSINVFGSPFFEKCRFKNGIAMLLCFPINIGKSLFSVVRSAAAIFEKAHGFAVHHKAHSKPQIVLDVIILSPAKMVEVVKENSLRELPFFRRMAKKTEYDNTFNTKFDIK